MPDIYDGMRDDAHTPLLVLITTLVRSAIARDFVWASDKIGKPCALYWGFFF